MHDNEELERGTFHLRGLGYTDIITVAVVRVPKYRETKKKRSNSIYSIYVGNEKKKKKKGGGTVHIRERPRSIRNVRKKR